MNPMDQSVFEGVTATPVVPATTGLVRLAWQAPGQGDRLVQVYVDGRLHAVTADAATRQMWLTLRRDRACVIELVAVDAAVAWADHRDHLAATANWRSRAELRLVRDETLPADTRVRVSVDGRRRVERALWSAGDPRGGFGGAFGIGSFGRAYVGFAGAGLGAFGHGPFAVDSHPWRWRSASVGPGPHTIEAQAIDAAGRVVAELTEGAVPAFEADRLPPGAENLRLEATGPTGLRIVWDAE